MRKIGCWTHLLRSGFCPRSASAPRPRMCERMWWFVLKPIFRPPPPASAPRMCECTLTLSSLTALEVRVVNTTSANNSYDKTATMKTLGFQWILDNPDMTKITETLDHVPTSHDDVIKWKHFPRYWPFVWGIHQSPMNSPHKGQRRGAFISLTCARINGWVNNREAGDLRRNGAHYDVIVMPMRAILRTITTSLKSFNKLCDR